MPAKLPKLKESDVEKLMVKIEESLRATKGSTSYFIEPASGVLLRAEGTRNHLIFGRRGSGKSSLLNKVAHQLSLKRSPNALIDLESYKGHAYPDVLISVLIDIFGAFSTWLETVGSFPSNKLSWWKKILGGKPSRKQFPKNSVSKLRDEIEKHIVELRKQLFSADNLSVKATDEASNSNHSVTKANIGVKSGPLSSSLEEETGEKLDSKSSQEVSYKHEKIQYLTQHILDYQNIFKTLRAVSEVDAYLLLDDLYHIRKEDQFLVLDFLHRISKQHGLILKIGTIRHRSQWYLHGNPPKGLKLGDDADEINLDLSLEKFEIARKFLRSILDGMVMSTLDRGLSDIVTEDCIERLVLASGGVARDYLGIFRNALEVRKNKQKSRTEFRVSVEDINEAAGDYDTNKREELKRDTFEDRARLEATFKEVCDFCLDETKANIFLIEKDDPSPKAKDIMELVDLRLIHYVEPRVTLRKFPRKVFEAYMLDISQYSGSRKRRKFKIIEFWKKKESQLLRNDKFLFRTESEE